jgi:Uri superfamily endonuclease
VSDLPFPPSHGTYILITHLPASTVLTIGRLGTFPFTAGLYAYVGSAFGTGGLRGRLKHHLAPNKRLHWHMDYLVQAAPIQAIWYLANETPREHDWAAIVAALPDVTTPIHRFGASDCKCPAHLFYASTLPSFNAFHTMAFPHGDIQRWVLTSFD